MTKIRYMSILVAVLGIVSLLIGAAFIGLAVQKNNYIVDSLRVQNVTTGLTQEQIAQGQVVDSAQEAQVAAEVLAEHLKSIAPTYGDLMAANGTGRYDPTNPSNLSYSQGLNLQNSFNMVVLSFGVIQEAMITGVALIIIGIAVGATGLVLLRLSKREPELIRP